MKVDSTHGILVSVSNAKQTQINVWAKTVLNYCHHARFPNWWIQEFNTVYGFRYLVKPEHICARHKSLENYINVKRFKNRHFLDRLPSVVLKRLFIDVGGPAGENAVLMKLIKRYLRFHLDLAAWKKRLLTFHFLMSNSMCRNIKVQHV